MGMLESYRQSIRLVRDHHQMNMVGHQTVANQRGFLLFGAFTEQAQINFSIYVAVQDKRIGN